MKEPEYFWILHYNIVLMYEQRTEYDQFFVFVTILEKIVNNCLSTY